MDQPPIPSFREALRVWLRIGCLGFGGPAGQVALMHEELVVRRRWLSEDRFLHALNYCMLLPGPEAQQLATYAGWLLHRGRGGLAAGVLFVLPGALVVLALSALYAELQGLPLLQSLFFGLKAAVVALVVQAVLRVGRRALMGRAAPALAALAFLGIAVLHLPFPLIILGAAACGLSLSRLAPGALPPPSPPAPSTAAAAAVVDRLEAQGLLEHTRPSRRRALRVLLIGLLLWLAPVGAAALIFGTGSVFFRQGVFFAQTAVVSFGGAYAVLAYVVQEAVHVHGWLDTAQMVDGLGLAETTPGPLILVLEFVAFLGAHGRPGSLPPLAAGTGGALLCLWATFAPSFLWIFLGAPYVEAARRRPALASMLQAITAAVLGVMANLSLWFALHVLFRRVNERSLGPLRLTLPELGSVDPLAFTLTALALLATLRLRLSAPWTLGLCAGLGLLLR